MEAGFCMMCQKDTRDWDDEAGRAMVKLWSIGKKVLDGSSEFSDSLADIQGDRCDDGRNV
jgi:hypothetical protein